MRPIKARGVFFAALVSTATLIAQVEEGLEVLSKIAPQYKDYRAERVSLPVEISGVSVKVIGRVSRFARQIGGRLGALPLTGTEKKEAARTFDVSIR